ncbi:hypothetical protein VM1G_09089 [Cytospora mali]|uniref:SUR7 family protein pun1 n=1 Tax=Cytospora mali TaxID=578113 RepID=A0A194WAP6_CYTMA|nr:hypothetical protein VM1G_09089 [Valsa mali]
MKLTVGIPLVLSIAAFALALVALLAGKDPGMMEDYHIIVFNTSTLGHNYISSLSGDSSSSSTTTTATPTSTSDGGGIGGFFSSLKASATAIVGSVESEAASILNDIGNDVADKLADELGIEQFYSLHVMDTCEGNYAPNATTSGAWANVTNCTTPMDFSSMNISAMLDKELSIGPFNLSLSDLGITDDLQSKLNDLPKLFEALAAMYILSVAFSGLAILGSAAGLFYVSSTGRKVIIANFVIASLAMLFLLVGSLLTTVGGSEAKKEIKKKGGDDIGLVMNLGKKFEAITWAAFAMMLLATFYWVYEFIVATRARRRGVGAYGRRRGQFEKNSMDSHQNDGRPLKG